jgi:hypothetical protein
MLSNDRTHVRDEILSGLHVEGVVSPEQSRQFLQPSRETDSSSLSIDLITC